jgi:aldehyde:ferredoxin oxidoreductase
MEGCYACPIRCKKVIQFDEPYTVKAAYGGPEYEALAGLGSNLGVSDAKAVCKANERCNAYSLDAISAGDTIAFAMECYEKGLITREDTGGLELKFGNSEAALQAIELISRREGFGNVMAEGVARMAKKIGKGCEEFALNTKGLEPAMPDPRTSFNISMGYLLNPHGADHVSCEAPMGMMGIEHFGVTLPVPDGGNAKRVSLFKLSHCLIMLQDLLVICAFPPFDYDTKIELLRAVTGWNSSWVELIKVGERVLTTMRLFNLREGFTAADDSFPAKRYFQDKLGKSLPGPIPLSDESKIQKARELYYSFMGWDKNGVPTPEKVEDLDIE